MKNFITFLAVIAIVLASVRSYSQPQVKVHIFGGYNLPLPDLKGTYPTDAANNPPPYFMKSGFTVGADGKYFLGIKRNFGITLSLAYNSFSTGDITGFREAPDTVSGTFNEKLNSFTVGIGAEYDFLPTRKANPFIGLEFTGNFFSGSRSFVSSTSTLSSTLKSAARFGLQANLGVDISLSPRFGIVIGAKYHMANLIGKDTVTGTGTEYGLNDKEVTVGTTSYSAKKISWLTFYAGVAIFFLKPHKMKM